MSFVTVPDVHGTVEGRPPIGRVEEKSQLLALVTWADRVTGPPAAPSDEGAASKAATVGDGVVTLETATGNRTG